jgi:hypothetical protein
MKAIINTANRKGAYCYSIYEKADSGKKCKPEDYENPYDPDCTDYDDFFDGWCMKRDNPQILEVLK